MSDTPSTHSLLLAFLELAEEAERMAREHWGIGSAEPTPPSREERIRFTRARDVIQTAPRRPAGGQRRNQIDTVVAGGS
jgi:hypothetical protein